MTDKTPRSAQTRENGERPKAWSPPALLPDPDPKPGFRRRYVRTRSVGHDDSKGVSMRLREGFQPVSANEHANLMLPKSGERGREDTIEIGGLILMEIPEETAVQREQYYRDLSKDQVRSFQETMFKESDPIMPVLNPSVKSTTSFGKGIPPIQGD